MFLPVFCILYHRFPYLFLLVLVSVRYPRRCLLVAGCFDLFNTWDWRIVGKVVLQYVTAFITGTGETATLNYKHHDVYYKRRWDVHCSHIKLHSRAAAAAPNAKTPLSNTEKRKMKNPLTWLLKVGFKIFVFLRISVLLGKLFNFPLKWIIFFSYFVELYLV